MAVVELHYLGVPVAHKEGTTNSTFKVGDNVTLGQGSYVDATGQIDFGTTDLVTSGDVTLTGAVDLSGATSVSVPTPTSSGHAANKGYVDNVASNISNKGSVLAYQDTPPVSPNDGDKYLVKATATGDWAGQEGKIATYDSDTTSWSFSSAPVEGWVVFNQDDSDSIYGDRQLVYTDSGWDTFSSTIYHENLPDVDSGTYKHLTATQRTALTGGASTDADAQHTHDSKADKVSSPTAGNFAGLDVNGNLTDSGSSSSDFASASHSQNDSTINISGSHDALLSAASTLDDALVVLDDLDDSDLNLSGSHDGNLSASTTLADAMAVLDDLSTGTSTASETSTVVTSFDGLLSASDDDVQKALDTLDDHGVTDHKASGLTAGHVLRATGADSMAFGAIQASDLPSNIDALKIGSGDVTNTEYGYLANVTSDIQDQIDGKADSSHNHDTDYISIISSPTAGNAVKQTAGGELEDAGFAIDEYEGSLTLKEKTVSNTTLDLGSSANKNVGFVSAYADTANVTITLPDLATNVGKQYVIDAASITGAYKVNVQRAGTDTLYGGYSQAQLGTTDHSIRLIAGKNSWKFDAVGATLS